MATSDSSRITLKLDGSDDSWIQRIRQAEEPLPLGRLGDYELLDEVSRGGQGIVYRARQPGTNRDVALKRMLAGSLASDQVRQRFVREIEASAGLNHRHIVTVYGSEEVDGQPLLTMEWVDGVTVTEWARRQGGGRRSARALVLMVIAIADALRHAHQRGVIHRDLKPSNILVDADNQPYLLDFGLAKLIFSDLNERLEKTTAEQFVGTIAYAAPEQLAKGADEVDVRTDVYALGVVFYEMLTGQRPYSLGKTLPEALRAIEQQDPPAPSRHNPEVDPEIDAIVLKALEKDRARRYQSIDALLGDLTRYLAGDVVQAHPPGTWYRLTKFVRRHAMSVAFAGTVLILIIAFGVTAGLFWRSAVFAQQNEASARQAENDAREVAEQINAFLQEMLASADPRHHGSAVTVKEVLDRAAAEIDGELGEHPLVLAGAQQTIGETYHHLGFFELAQPHLAQALATRQSVLGRQHEDVAASLHALGTLHHDMGLYASAGQQLADALEMRTALLGPVHPDVAETMQQLGKLQIDTGDYAAAENSLRKALELRSALEEADSPELASSMYQLGELLTDLARYDEAEPLYRHALHIMRGAHQGDHPDVEQSLRHLGHFLVARAAYEEAETTLTEALEMSQRLWNGQHPEEAYVLRELGWLKQRQGAYAEAESLYRQALEMNQDLLDADHPEVATSMSQLAELLRASGNLDEAEQFFREVLQLRAEALGKDHPDVVTSKNNLAAVLYARGDYAAAEPLMRETLEANRRLWGDSHPHVAISVNNLGKLLHEKGEYQEAERLLREALELSRQIDGPDHPTTALRAHNLAKTLEAQGKFDEAEQFYREALDIRTEALGFAHRHTAQSLHALGSLMMLQRDYEQAELMLTEAVQVRRETMGPDHWFTAYSESALAEALTVLQQYPDAEGLLLHSYEVMKKERGTTDARTVEVLNRLIQLYEAWGETAIADDYRKQLPQD